MIAQTFHKAELHRRALIGLAAAGRTVTLLPTRLGASELGSAWLANDNEARRLSELWSRLESEAASQMKWFKLTQAERAATDIWRRMNTIDQQLAQLFDARERQLVCLAATRARDLNGVASKLAVAVRLVQDEDSRTGDLISGALADLRARA